MDNVRNAVRFVIADDHPIFRDSLRMLLEAQPGFRVVGDAGDGAEAVKLVSQLKPDILLLDLAMPRYSGLAALRDLGNSSTPVRVIVLAAAIEKAQMMEALQLGAQGLVLKECTVEELMKSIQSVLAGKFWVVRESLADLAEAEREPRGSAKRDKLRHEFGLTPREIEIIELIATAYRNSDIAEKCSISARTVKRHITNILRKLRISNRLELAIFAIHHELVDGS